MSRTGLVGLLFSVIVLLLPSLQTPVLAQALPVPNAEAVAAAKASPALVDTLAKELGSTPAQAAGAAGSIFSVAQSRLKPEEFSQIAKAVPGMDALLKAAPGGAVGGGLAGLAGAFGKLGLSPALVSKAIPIVQGFLTKSGGANLGSLLAGVLK